jgi:putative phosphoesterase
MRIGVISDIHGNIYALKKVLGEIKKLDIKEIYFLGDIVGYYYDADKCIDLLLKYRVKSIYGNHEKLFLRSIKDKNLLIRLSKKYGSSIKDLQFKLKHKHLKWLKNLPKTIKLNQGNHRILFCHGSPWSVYDYLYKEQIKKLKNKINKINYNLLFVGNTHVQNKLNLKNLKVINPGSVGQPRKKGSSDSQWCYYDLSSNKVFFKNTTYDKSKLLKKINKFDPKIKYLKEVLSR